MAPLDALSPYGSGNCGYLFCCFHGIIIFLLAEFRTYLQIISYILPNCPIVYCYFAAIVVSLRCLSRGGEAVMFIMFYFILICYENVNVCMSRVWESGGQVG